MILNHRWEVVTMPKNTLQVLGSTYELLNNETRRSLIYFLHCRDPTHIILPLIAGKLDGILNQRNKTLLPFCIPT